MQTKTKPMLTPARTPCVQLFVIMLLALLLGLSQTGVRAQGAGQVQCQLFSGNGGSSRDELQLRRLMGLQSSQQNASTPIYQDYTNHNPTIISYVTSLQHADQTAYAPYGEALIGFIVPTNTGWYRFAVQSYAGSVLWMSTDENPANLQVLAWTINNNALANRYDRTPEQQSGPIHMVANQPYYFELIHVRQQTSTVTPFAYNGAAGPSVTCAWRQLSDRTDPTLVTNNTPPIDGTFLKSYLTTAAASIHRHPANLTMATNTIPTLQTNKIARFDVQFDGDAPFFYQWYTNGVPMGDVKKTCVPRAEVEWVLRPDLNGMTVQVQVTNQASAGTWVVSSTATLTVTADTTAPVLSPVSLSLAYDGTFVYSLRFNEVVDLTSFSASDFSFSSGDNTVGAIGPVTTIPGQSFGSINHFGLYQFTTATELPPGTVITLAKVKDLDGNEASTVTATVYKQEGGWKSSRYTNFGNDANNGVYLYPLVNSPKFPYFASSSTIKTGNTYYDDGTQMGYRDQWLFRPDRTGTYYFAITLYMRGALYMSTNALPAGKRLICGEQANILSVQRYCDDAMQRSGPIRLEAGKEYYMEVVRSTWASAGNIIVGHMYYSDPNGTGPTMDWHLTRPTSYITGPVIGGSSAITIGAAIPRYMLSPYREALSLDAAYPQDGSTVDCVTGGYTVDVRPLSGTPMIAVQWYTNDVAVPDATNRTYNFAPSATATYYCVLNNDVNTVTSRVATVTVTPGATVAPTIASAAASGASAVSVLFDQQVTAATAETAGNYAVTNLLGGTVSVSTAALQGDGRTVVLSLATPLSEGVWYKVRVSNVANSCGGVMVAGSGTNFVYKSLVGYWTFEEGSGTTAHDLTGNNDAGVPSWIPWASSPFGAYALAFNAAGINCGDPLARHITGPMTLCAWVNPSSVSGSRIMSKTGNLLGTYGWELGCEDTGEWSFRVGRGGGTGVSEVRSAGASEGLGQWTHVCGVYHPSVPALLIYTNGVLAAVNDFDAPLEQNNAANVMFIGARSSGGLNFQGVIDSVRVYNRALSAAEVAVLGHASPATQPQLVPMSLGGQMQLSWPGGGSLEWASDILGPWTTILPMPPAPYSEPINTGTNRFYRVNVTP